MSSPPPPGGASGSGHPRAPKRRRADGGGGDDGDDVEDDDEEAYPLTPATREVGPTPCNPLRPPALAHTPCRQQPASPLTVSPSRPLALGPSRPHPPVIPQVPPEGTVVYAHGTDPPACPICLEALREPVAIKGACTHSFCRECLVAHLARARTCPECRAKAPARGR